MKSICVYDPTISDPLSSARGGGRFIQLLRNYCGQEITFIDKPNNAPTESTLVMPFWFPFHPPQFFQTKSQKRVLVIFDAIPLKYPSHFPIGIKGQLFKWINSFQAHNYDRIITISETSKKDIAKYLDISHKKISVTYLTVGKNFLNAPIEPKSYRLKTNSFCLYVGDVNWNKNLPNLARAVKQSNIPCVFVGRPFGERNREAVLSNSAINPWLADFKQFLIVARDNPQFIFTENIRDDNLAWLYKNALCNLLVSYDEGFGLSYIEAGHFSTPSILSDTPIFHEIAEDSALFVDPNKPDEINKAIDNLANDKNIRDKLSKKSLNRSLFFSPKSFATSFLSSVNDL